LEVKETRRAECFRRGAGDLVMQAGRALRPQPVRIGTGALQ
jgi:hypothetical protein